MTLSGPLLPWMLWTAALALFIWMVIAWPRSAGPGPLMVARRIGFQLGLVALVLLSVGVSLNNSYGWYANWADLGSLFDSGEPAGDVVTSGSVAASAAAMKPGKGRPAPSLAVIAAREGKFHLVADPGPGGQYRDVEIPGPDARTRGLLTIWFPRAYTERSHATERFPVLEAFHGIPGAPHQLSVALGLGATVAGQVAAGHLANSVIIMPNYFPRDLDTECVNGGGQNGIPMENWLAREVTTWVQDNLRVSTARTDWATIGISAGAYCASMLTMLHPDIFSAAISLGGYFEPVFEVSYRPFERGTPPARRYDLVRVAHANPPPVALWVQTSAVDALSYITTSKLLAKARPPMSVTADVLHNAGHRVGVWNALIPQTLEWLGRTAPGFRPLRPSLVGH